MLCSFPRHWGHRPRPLPLGDHRSGTLCPGRPTIAYRAYQAKEIAKLFLAVFVTIAQRYHQTMLEWPEVALCAASIRKYYDLGGGPTPAKIGFDAMKLSLGGFSIRLQIAVCDLKCSPGRQALWCEHPQV
jgi:hypothetical protein